MKRFDPLPLFFVSAIGLLVAAVVAISLSSCGDTHRHYTTIIAPAAPADSCHGPDHRPCHKH